MIAEMAVYMIPAAIVGSRVLYVMMNFGEFGDHLSDTLKIWQGGLAFSGGDHRRHVDAFPVCERAWAFLLEDGRSMGARRRHWGRVSGGLDASWPAAASVIPRVPFWGLSLQIPIHWLPLAFPSIPHRYLPRQAGLGLTLVLVIIHTKKQFSGQVLLWYLILHGTISLFIEKYRGDGQAALLGGTMGVTQCLSLVILAWAVISLFILKSRESADRRY